MILKRFSVFYILLFLCLGAATSRAQASLQRGVRISNANGNIVSILTGGTTQTYSLILPLASNPSLTTGSLLYGLGNGDLNWTDAAGAVDGSILTLQTSGGNLLPTWVAPSAAGNWLLIGNAIASAWNGAAGSFLGTTSTQPLVLATTNTITPQPIEFFTNNAEKVRIDASGNVGINQTNPSQLLEVRNGNFLLSNSGAADQLQFQGTSTGLTTFQAGAQGATNINYTLPTAAAVANGYVLTSTTGGLMSWTDPLTLLTSDWHLTGNTGTTAWNGATGNIIGTLDAQDFVIGTGAVAGTREKVRITQAGNLQLSQPGTQLSFLGTGTGVTTFQAGAQGATNINYTLPTAAAVANGYVLSSTTGGVMSWTDPATLASSDWHITGNIGTTAWNGATGNFLGTTDVQPVVVATTNTITPQPIEFFTNNAEKMRLSATGNLGINQTNPSQLLEVRNGNFLLSNSGAADQLQFQGTSTGLTTFQAGAQGATNINYTLPTAAAVANGYVLSSTTGGVMSWTDPATLASSDWHIIGNIGTTSWNGATGNFLGTTDAQPVVVATTNTITPQPIEFFTNNAEKMRLSANGNLGIGQTNPSQLLEVRNGNFLLSNSGAADQLQFQGTSTGLTTFQAGAQGATNINYTLPTAAAVANGYVLSSTTGGVMSWTDPATLASSDWHITGNIGTTSWNGATGNFLGTTDAQPVVVATTNTITPQPIEFFTNNAEKMRLSATGNLGIGQTNPSQLLEVRNGNFLLSNSGAADQLQFQGTSTGLTTFQAGAQGATNINYTLPTAAAVANGYVLSSTTGGVMSWTDPATLPTSDWHLTGNLGTSAWNGAAGNIIGTLDAQDFVIGTGAVAGTREKVRITQAGNLQLSQPGTQLSFLGTGAGVTTFQAGAQGAANINYTLPIVAAAANNYVLASTTVGVLSWIDATTVTNDWHLIGNATATSWNGAAGNFLGTTSTQPLVVATTNTVTPQPIEFFTNNTEKVRIDASGNLGIGQTNPSQLLEVRNGNFLLSNSGAADQLQFQGTSTGLTTFQAGAQGATNINYTLPTAAAVANGYVLSSTTGGVMSWTDPATLASSDWHITGNIGTTAWNGATGNFLGTTDVQPVVVATTNTITPQPIEFFTNNAEKMRLSAAGNLGIGQTNPSQLLEVRNGNFFTIELRCSRPSCNSRVQAQALRHSRQELREQRI